MIKICALDFLKKETFETDVMSAKGDILFSADDKVTPELILRLYFKDIYVLQPLSKPEIETEEAKTIRLLKEKESELTKNSVLLAEAKMEETQNGVPFKDIETEEERKIRLQKENEFDVTRSAGSSTAPETEEAKKIRLLREAEIEEEEKEKARALKLLKEEAEPKKLKFDEEQATRVAKYALEMADIIGFGEEIKKELEKAAFYHKVGVVAFTTDDQKQPDFRTRVAKASYSYIIKKLKFSDEVADVATLYYEDYVPSNFELNKKKGSNIPLYHIVAIASYYDEFLTKTSSKEEAIMKMLRLGGHKFNIFILHKFIYRMRTKND